MAIRIITSAKVSDAMLSAFNSGLSEVGHSGDSVARGNNIVEEDGNYDDKENAQGAKSALYTDFKSADSDKGVNLIISAGGLVAAHAAQDQIQQTPFLVIVGQFPKKFSLSTDKDPTKDKFCGGVNLNMVGENIARHDFLVGHYGIAADKVCLIWNDNSKMGKNERKEWANRGWKDYEVKTNDETNVRAAFKNAHTDGYLGAVVSGDPYFAAHKDWVVDEANKSTMKICYPFGGYMGAATPPTSKSSMIFGPDLVLAYRLVGRKAGAILDAGAPLDTGLDTCPKMGPFFIGG